MPVRPGRRSPARPLGCVAVLCLGLWLPAPAAWGAALEPPQDFRAFDMPDDSGGAVALTWRAGPADAKDLRYQVFAAHQAGGPFLRVAEFPADTRYLADRVAPWWAWPARRDVHFIAVRSSHAFPLEDGRPAYFKVALTDGVRAAESPVETAAPLGNLFNRGKLNNCLLLLALSGVIRASIQGARRGREYFVRRIPGLDAVEEAIGRATEMGRPILYLTGSGDMGDVSTIAATVVLGEVAKRAATYGTEIRVPHRDPIVMAVCQEVQREGCLAAGRPDAYKEDSNFFITTDQFSYTAAVDGIMLRERPAANFFMGSYFAESLLLAETGASTGAIQIAGTDSDAQLPFFITACDYTLIGEELYAASAYLSRERVLLGTLRGQDVGKAIFLLAMVVGAVLAAAGALLGTAAFKPLLQLFTDFK
ncbi:MAG TPA: DUF6754 domain-containing protein [Candidatus Methylomirabilis sp.]